MPKDHHGLQPGDLPGGGETKQKAPASPELAFWIARLGFVLALALHIAGHYFSESLALLLLDDPPWAVVLHAMLSPEAQTVAWYLALAGLVIIGIEALSAVLTILFHRRLARTGVLSTVRVRVLQPFSRQKAPSINPVEVWRSLAGALAITIDAARSPVALTLSRLPNSPTNFGFSVLAQPKREPSRFRFANRRNAAEEPAEPRLKERRGGFRPPRHPAIPAIEHEANNLVVTAIGNALARFDDTLTVDAQPDPLQTSLRDGCVVVCRDLGVRRAYLAIKAADDFDSPLLSTVGRALQPGAGVLFQEVQVIVAPQQLSHLNRWFAQSRHAVDQRKSVGDERVQRTAALLEDKLTDEHFETTVRLVAVAESQATVQKAHDALDLMQAAFAELALKYRRPEAGATRQQLRVIQTQQIPVRQAATAAKPRPTPLLLRLIGWLALASVLVVAFQLVQQLLGDGMPPLPELAAAFGWPAAVAAALAGCWLIAEGYWTLQLGRLRAVLMRLGRPMASIDPLIVPRPLWKQPMILSAAEGANFWTIPTEATGRDIEWLPNRVITPPPDVFVPAEAADWLVLGHWRTTSGTIEPVGVQLKALHQVMHVTAGVGSGKSQFLAAAAHQLIPNGFCILDGKGDDEGGGLAANVLHSIPVEDEHRAVFLDLLDTAHPAAINPLYDLMLRMEQTDDHSVKDVLYVQALGIMTGILERLDPSRWKDSPGMNQYAQMGAHLVLRTGSSQPGEVPTMARLKRALEYDSFRARLLAGYPHKHDDVYDFWVNRHPDASESQKSSLAALLRRLDLLLTNPITRSLMTVEQPTIDVLDIMETGKILLIPMPHNKLSGLADLIGTMIVQAIFSAAYLRKGDAQTRKTFPVMVDEVQIFINGGESRDFSSAIAQVRGYGIALILAHQALNQLGTMKEEVLVNAANRLILRTSEPDASVYARNYANDGIGAEDIRGQAAREHQYAVAMTRSGKPRLFSIIPLRWPERPPQCLDTRGLPISRQDWRRAIPPVATDMPAEEANQRRAVDKLIASVMHATRPHADYTRIVQQLSLLPADEWALFLARWTQIRAHQYQLLLDAPQLLPDRYERIVALNRLSTRTAALIEDVQVLRQAWEDGASVTDAPAVPDHTKRATEHAQEYTSRTEALRTIEGSSDEPIAPPSVADASDDAQRLLAARRRPTKADYQPGYDALLKQPAGMNEDTNPS